MDWLDFVVQGGALVLLAVVLYGAWKLGQQLVEILKAQSEYIRVSTEVQARLCERVQMQEKRAEERHDEVMAAIAMRAARQAAGG